MGLSPAIEFRRTTSTIDIEWHPPAPWAGVGGRTDREPRSETVPPRHRAACPGGSVTDWLKRRPLWISVRTSSRPPPRRRTRLAPRASRLAPRASRLAPRASRLGRRLQPGLLGLPPALAGGERPTHTLAAEPALAGLPRSAVLPRAKAAHREARLKPADKGNESWHINHQLKLVADRESRLKPAKAGSL